MARTAAVPCHAIRLKVGLLRVDLCPPVSACVDGYFVQLCPNFQLSEGACHASGLTHTGPWDQCAGMGGQWSYGMHKGCQSTLCQSFASRIFEILKYESIISMQHSMQPSMPCSGQNAQTCQHREKLQHLHRGVEIT